MSSAMTPAHQETQMETSPADKARGEESQQVHLLSQVAKKQKSHTILLYTISFCIILYSASQIYISKVTLELSKKELETAKAQLEATKAKVKAEKAGLEADIEYYRMIRESFEYLYTRLNKVERACSQPSAP